MMPKIDLRGGVRHGHRGLALMYVITIHSLGSTKPLIQ